MGVAAYNRGTDVIREQIRGELADKQPQIDRRSERERIKELQTVIQDMQAKLSSQTARADKAIKLMNWARGERDRYRKALPAKLVVARLREVASGAPLQGRLMLLYSEMIKIEEEST